MHAAQRASGSGARVVADEALTRSTNRLLFSPVMWRAADVLLLVVRTSAATVRAARSQRSATMRLRRLAPTPREEVTCAWASAMTPTR